MSEKLVVSASLIAKPVFSNKRRPLSLRVGVEVEVIATPDIREAQNYPRSPSEAVRVCREIPQSFAGVDNFRSRKFVR